jgi:dihydropyrimidine dehydrogenase (NAD+) subunit PreT
MHHDRVSPHLPQAGGTHDALSERFTDLAPPLTARQAAIESARCLYCYDAPCTRACPTGIDVASFIRNIHDHNIDGAATTILQQNIFGGSCARVCPTEILCEDACVRNHDAEGQPVKIGLLQRHAIDNAQFDGHPFKRAPRHRQDHRRGRRRPRRPVLRAPPGDAGPRRGGVRGARKIRRPERIRHRQVQAAGRLRPAEVEFLLSIGGIEIRTATPSASTCSWPTCTRATTPCSSASAWRQPRAGPDRRGRAGPDGGGRLHRHAAPGQDLAALPVPRRAIVIGAGNTAIDMAVQLKRLGADEVTLVYRRGFDAMSATGHEIEIAKTHFVRMRTWAAPLEVLLDDAGRVRGMRFEETRLQDGRLVDRRDHRDRGRRRVQGHRPGHGTGRAGRSAGAEIERSDKILVDDCFRTALPGVYAGGDCVAPGQDLTVQAVQHGKLAALAIHHDIQSKAEAAWPT